MNKIENAKLFSELHGLDEREEKIFLRAVRKTTGIPRNCEWHLSRYPRQGGKGQIEYSIDTKRFHLCWV